MANPTVNVYVDGFNLYYGKLKGQPYKWLDIQSLFEDLMPGYEVKRVKYFTARVKSRANDLQAPARQSAYLRALETLPKVSIYYGQYTVHNVRMALSDPNAVPRTVEVIKTEEKGSDVNLAAHLMMDAFRNDADVYLVVSNDSDLTEPLRMTKTLLKKHIGIAKTYPQVSKSLMRCKPDFIRDIRSGALAANQLPDVLIDANGKITKPVDWS
jgi:hypothetical protein